MGAEDDPMAVVNNKTEVFGVENLRIVDASIMPSIDLSKIPFYSNELFQ